MGSPSAEAILGKTFDCKCGQQHRVPLKTVIYTEDALSGIPDILDRDVKGRKAALLSDRRTYEILGSEVEQIVSRTGRQINTMVVPDGPSGTPICDDKTFDRLKPGIGQPDVFFSVGSGVINDLTKWLSFSAGAPYISIPTAASMNGYTAANVAPTIAGVKSLVRAHAPVAVLSVPSVIEQAPFELTASGLGDAVAKSVSVADWKLNHLLFGEHFCPFCADIISEIEPLYFDHPEIVADRSREGVKAVFDALVYSGLAMTLIGTSAPASGGEHLFSHTLDMMSRVDGVPHDLHGRQVGLGTLFSAVLYEKLQALESPGGVDMPPAVDRTFWGVLAEPVSAQYEAKNAHLKQMSDLLRSPEKWRRVRDTICSLSRPPGAVADCLAAAHAARFVHEIKCDRRRARNALLHMHEIRKRCTVVDLAWVTGILPGAVDEILDQWLIGP
jgi:glycerol-1-phosphate dehydrogenase [NAD(P)+]